MSYAEKGSFRDRPLGVFLTSEVGKTVVSFLLPTIAAAIVALSQWLGNGYSNQSEPIARSLWEVEIEFWEWVLGGSLIDRYLLIHAEMKDGHWHITIFEEFNPTPPGLTDEELAQWPYVQAMQNFGGRRADRGYVENIIEPLLEQSEPFYVEAEDLRRDSELRDSFEMSNRDGVYLLRVAMPQDDGPSAILFLAAADSPPLASSTIVQYRMRTTAREMREAIGY